MNDPTRPPSPDADQELDALFASMKQDHAPVDVEERILHAIGPALGTGALAAKTGAWSRLVGLLKASTAAKLGAVGLVSGGVALSTAALLDAPSARRSPALATVAPSAPLAPPSAPVSAGSLPPSPPADPVSAPVASAALPAVSPTPAPSTDRRAGTDRDTRSAAPPSAEPPPAATQGASPAPDTTAPTSPPAVRLDPVDGVFAPPASPSSAATATVPPTSAASAPPADVLRHEVALVRRIAALVDAGDCARARPLIAEHRAGHATGQLAAEVTVLAARCQGR